MEFLKGIVVGFALTLFIMSCIMSSLIEDEGFTPKQQLQLQQIIESRGK